MFAKANVIARQFTKAVVISYRLKSGKCATSIAAFVVLNRDGWIITAHHVVDGISKANKAVMELNEYERKRADIEANASLSRKQRHAALGALGKVVGDPPVAFSVWWNDDRLRVEDFQVLPAADLAVGRLSGFDPDVMKTAYPVLKDPNRDFEPGTSLCKLGFPLHSIVPTYDEQQKAFILPPGSVPPPLFPIEGIYTRNIQLPNPDPKRPFPLLFLETSSPGLKGQSGGPIFDQHGTIWAIQSRTIHYPLGFDPAVPGSKKHEREHQFLNAGVGAHAATVVGMLRELNIDFAVSDY